MKAVINTPEKLDFEKTLDWAKSAELFGALVGPIEEKITRLLGGRSYPVPVHQSEYDQLVGLRNAIMAAWEEHAAKLEAHLIETWPELCAAHLAESRAKEAEILAALENVKALCKERAQLAATERTNRLHYINALRHTGQGGDDTRAHGVDNMPLRAFSGFILKPGAIQEMQDQVFVMAQREATK